MLLLTVREDLGGWIEHAGIPVSVPVLGLTALAALLHNTVFLSALNIENIYYTRQELLKCTASL